MNDFIDFHLKANVHKKIEIQTAAGQIPAVSYQNIRFAEGRQNS